MTALDVGLIMFGLFALLIVLRVPVAFALGLACVPVFFIDERLTPFLLLNEMLKSYNSFILLAIPFFMLSANLMNSAGVTERLMELARTMVGWFPGGLGHINVVVSMIFAGISGSSTAEAAGIGGVMIPAMKKQGYDTEFTVALTACAAVMGVIIPPSILMVVWGGVISVSIGALLLFCIGTASAFGWLLAYFHLPQLFVDAVKSYGGGVTSVGFITAIAFLIIGCFIDAIPAIIIVGTVLAPLAKSVGMHPLHFAIVGVISIAFGLVTPPYGLCLMIACALGKTTIARAFKDTMTLLGLMLLVLGFVILFPDVILALPRWVMPKFVQ